MPLGADALVAVLAGHVVVEHPVGHLPGRVLRIGQGVEIDDRRADRRGDVDRPGVVRDQERGHGEERRQLGQVKLAGQRDECDAHRGGSPRPRSRSAELPVNTTCKPWSRTSRRAAAANCSGG